MCCCAVRRPVGGGDALPCGNQKTEATNAMRCPGNVINFKRLRAIVNRDAAIEWLSSSLIWRFRRGQQPAPQLINTTCAPAAAVAQSYYAT